MSDVARSAALIIDAVSKRYRVYERPGYRLLDLFGLCPEGSAYYREIAALTDVSVTIGRGEKVAIIGRNGAGKSTLLKLVTGGLEPSAGSVRVLGRLSPLLQIGAGFHGDFTGRQNVFANLAHMGIVGHEASVRFDEIVDFSELEAFIDQPVKTYSTGMAARLMFSAATAVEPDILVVDELLGVGDAYFAQKSFDRMRQMCERSGTTLLLVTHDLYSALNLCDRFVWIDGGRVQLDGGGRDTITAYEASIKAQEEARLRTRHARTLSAGGAVSGLRVVVRSRSGFALPRPLALGRLAVEYEDGRAVALEVADGSPSWVLAPDGNLGAPTVVEGRRCRVLSAYGSVYHKAEWAVAIPVGTGLARVRIDWAYEGDEAVDVMVTDDEHRILAKAALPTGTGWQTSAFPLAASGRPGTPDQAGHYGTGAIRITAVRWTDAEGVAVTAVDHGGRLVAAIDYEVVDPSAQTDVTLILVFQRAGSTASGYVSRDRLRLSGRTGTVTVTLEPVILGSGSWMVTIAVGKVGLFDEPYIPYFTINPAWHHFVARGWELTVRRTTSIDPWAFVELPADVQV